MTRLNRLGLAAALAVLFFFAYITAIRLAYTMFYAAALLGLVSWLWTRLGSRGLQLARESPSGAFEVGEEFAEPMVVHNRSMASLPWVEVIDRSDIPGYDAGRVVSVGRGRSRQWLSHGRFARRGRYQLGPTDVATGDPFGFFTRTRRVAPAASVTVYPRLLSISGVVPGTARTVGDTASAGRFLDSPPDALGIREHDPHDGFNRIHWPSTARLGRPMSKSFERFEGSDLLVVLDLEAAVHVGTAPRSTLEYAISLAASLAATSIGRAQSVALACNDRRLTTIGAGRGAAHLRRLLDHLAVAEANGTTDLDSLLLGLSGTRGRQGVLVITPRPAGPWLDRLLEAGGGGRTTVLHLDASTFTPAGSGNRARRPAQVTTDNVRWLTFAADHGMFEPLVTPAPARSAR